MNRITFETLLIYHDLIINATGGLPGVKNESLLISSLETPFITFGGEDLYPTDELKIAMTIYSLINNHGFNDANKRTGMLVFKILLELNNIDIEATEDEYIQLALDIANRFNKYDIVNWINNHKK